MKRMQLAFLVIFKFYFLPLKQLDLVFKTLLIEFTLQGENILNYLIKISILKTYFRIIFHLTGIKH